MIEPLHDAHTGLFAKDIGAEFDGIRPDPNHLERAQWEQAAEIIKSRYISHVSSYCNGHVQFGALDDGIGYLRITSFYGYADDESHAGSLKALQSALAQILQNPSKLQSLVIDVRQNNGGDDPLGIEIATRLTSSRYFAYRKIAREDRSGRRRFTAPQDFWVLAALRGALSQQNSPLDRSGHRQCRRNVRYGTHGPAASRNPPRS